MSEESYLRTLARFDGDIKRGNIPFDYRTGACGPVQATALKSWGAACPTGFCLPDNLPAQLGRWFAGDRAGCREVPYVVQLTGTRDAALDVAVAVTRNSTVTMCPTRIIAYATGARWDITSIKFGAVDQIIGGPVPMNVLDTAAYAAVPIVPDCFRAGQPMSFGATILPDAAVGTHSLFLVFIGPMVG